MDMSVMDDMVRTLAHLSEPQRREMIKARLKAFSEMKDDDRIKNMKAMIYSVHKLDEQGVVRLTYSRLESLAEDLDEHARMKLVGSHLYVLSDIPPQLALAEINAIMKALPQCHEACRNTLVSEMKRQGTALPPDRRNKLMQVLPESARGMIM